MSNADPASRPGEVASQSARAPRDLALRVMSACVLVPLALTMAYLGGWPFAAFWAVAACGILWEWSYLVFRKANAALLVPGGIALIGAFAVAHTGRPGAAAAVIAIGAVVAAAVATTGRRLWSAAGLVYAGAAFVGPVLLRHDSELGFIALVFLFAVVWTTDILGYFVGRSVGGPKLWPQVSPKKTWSGAVAGGIGAIAVGALTTYCVGIGGILPIAVVALLLSVVSQVGDLCESALKRRFAAKDTSALIPGHGGLMDRLDGFLVAALAAALIGLARQGLDAPARGLLIW